VEHLASQNPSSIKVILIATGVIFTICIVSIVGGLFFLDSAFSGLCGNEIFQEVYSPDHTYKAVVFQRDCGATTGFSTQVSILGASSKLPNDSGNILSMDGHPDWTQVQISWDGNRSVLIKYSDGYEIYSQKTEYRDFFKVFKVQYQAQKSQ
jgi:hypothetical protein